MEQLNDSLHVSEWNLSPEQHERLADASNFSQGYPMEWVDSSYANISGIEEFPPGHFRHPMDRN